MLSRQGDSWAAHSYPPQFPVTLLVLIPIIAVEYSSKWPIRLLPALLRVAVTRNIIGCPGGDTLGVVGEQGSTKE